MTGGPLPYGWPPKFLRVSSGDRATVSRSHSTHRTPNLQRSHFVNGQVHPPPTEILKSVREFRRGVRATILNGQVHPPQVEIFLSPGFFLSPGIFLSPRNFLSFWTGKYTPIVKFLQVPENVGNFYKFRNEPVHFLGEWNWTSHWTGKYIHFGVENCTSFWTGKYTGHFNKF